MLVLLRKVGETILIGDHIEVTVVRVCHNTVRIGIQAPTGYRIVREEIRDHAAGGQADPDGARGAITRLPRDVRRQPG